MNSITKYNGTSAYNLLPFGIDTRKANGLYTPNAIPLNGCLAYWDYANPEVYPGTGTTITDATSNNTNATLYGGIENGYSQPGVFDADGINDYIRSTNQVNLTYNNNGIGMGGWFRWDGTASATFGFLDRYFNNGGGDRYGIRIFRLNDVWYMFFPTPTSYAYFPTLSSNTWYFFYQQLKWNGGTSFTADAWIGTGTLTHPVNNVTYTSNLPSTSNQNIYLFQGDVASGGGYFPGDIGECFFYDDTFLSSDQVTRIYNNTKSRYGY